MNQRVAAFACLLFIGASVVAQERTAATIDVTLVEIPVNVYDRDGNAMRGLTADQFEITDDGKRQTITNFEEVDLDKYAADKRTPPVAAARRSFMLLFDLSSSTPATMTRARQAALDFVRNELIPSDAVAVGTYSADTGFNLLTSFTTDRDAVAAAVVTLGNPKFFKKSDPLLLSATMTGDGTMQAAPGSVDPADAIVAPDSATQTRQDEEYRRQRITKQLSALANIGRALDSVSGRKQIVLLSEGFDASLVQGRDAGSQQNQQDADKVLSGQSYEVDNDARFGNTTAANVISTLGDQLRRSDVVLHAIDIRGLRGTSDPGSMGGGKRSSNDSLYLLTRPTGGEVFKNANDLTSSFRSLLKQQEVVYVLGFNGNAKKPGQFHNLKVKVKAPGAKVSTRAGYYEPRTTVSPIEAALTAGEILLNDVTFDAVKTNVIASPFPVKGASPQVPVVLEIDGKSLMAGAKGSAVNAEIYVYAMDAENKIKDFLYQKVGLDLAKVGEPLQKSGLKFYGTLSLPPGQYAIKTLVRMPDLNHDGFKRVDVVVPDFTQPTLMQPIAMEPAGSWLMVRAAAKPGTPSVAYPFAIGADSFIPSTASATSPHQLALFAYNVAPNDLAVSGKLKMPDGSTRARSYSQVMPRRWLTSVERRANA